MNRIPKTFQELRSREKKALIPYITPEFPISGCTIPLILGLERAGASVIEVGIPFSDPIADGPTIQRSSHIAIGNGATLQRVLQSVKQARQETEIPIVLMGYINPILHYGMEKFLREAQNCGVDGVIVPDLLPEESNEWRSLSAKFGVSNVFLFAPTTSDERIHFLDSISTDFTYCVSVTGVTGARTGFGDPDGFEEFLLRVKKNTIKPFVVGFGISTPEHVSSVFRHADGAVIGSALLQRIEKEKSVEAVVRAAGKFLSSLAP